MYLTCGKILSISSVEKIVLTSLVSDDIPSAPSNGASSAASSSAYNGFGENELLRVVVNVKEDDAVRSKNEMISFMIDAKDFVSLEFNENSIILRVDDLLCDNLRKIASHFLELAVEKMKMHVIKKRYVRFLSMSNIPFILIN